jgi:hypothetical protein
MEFNRLMGVADMGWRGKAATSLFFWSRSVQPALRYRETLFHSWKEAEDAQSSLPVV